MVPEEKDDLQMLFPTVVQVSHLANSENINRQLLETIRAIREKEPNSKPQSWACDLYTTIGNPTALLGHPGLQTFLSIVQAKMTAYAKVFSFNVEQSPPTITEFWLNAYSTSHSQEIHLHRNSVFSGIYYVQAPKGSGPTLFYSPHADVMLEPRPTASNSVNTKVVGFPAEAGKMLLFRSNIRHSVLPGMLEGERITIAFNATM